MKIHVILLFLSFIVYKCDGENKHNLVFNLLGSDGKSYSHEILEKNERKVLYFVSPHCKISANFFKFISKLENGVTRNKYKSYLISPNYPNSLVPDDLAYTDLEVTLEGMKKLKKRFNLKMPFLYDGENQIVTNHYEIKTTPSVVLLDEKNRVFYKGKIGEVTPKGMLDTSYFEKMLVRNEFDKIITTKVRGTTIKTKKDMPTAINILQRYANETVKITDADQEKILFFKEFHNKKVTIFFIWQEEDETCRENLLKISEVFKIYRKRGLSLITICISQDKEKTLEALKQAQISGYNFTSTFYQVSSVFNLSGLDGRATPCVVIINNKGAVETRFNGMPEIDVLKTKVINILNN